MQYLLHSWFCWRSTGEQQCDCFPGLWSNGQWLSSRGPDFNIPKIENAARSVSVHPTPSYIPSCSEFSGSFDTFKAYMEQVTVSTAGMAESGPDSRPASPLVPDVRNQYCGQDILILLNSANMENWVKVAWHIFS
jgi:hypothetical protein